MDPNLFVMLQGSFYLASKAITKTSFLLEEKGIFWRSMQ
jgi:hypothetical protein